MRGVVLIQYKDTANGQKTPAARAFFGIAGSFMDGASVSQVRSTNPYSLSPCSGHKELKIYLQMKGRHEILTKLSIVSWQNEFSSGIWTDFWNLDCGGVRGLSRLSV